MIRSIAVLSFLTAGSVACASAPVPGEDRVVGPTAEQAGRYPARFKAVGRGPAAMPHNGLVFATDFNSGLWVARLVPGTQIAGAALSLHGAACYHAARLDRASQQGNWG